MRSDLSDDKHSVQLAAAEIAESSDTSGFYELASNGSANGIINNGTGQLHHQHQHHHPHLQHQQQQQQQQQTELQDKNANLLSVESLSPHSTGVTLRDTSRPKRTTRRMQMETAIDPDMTDSSSQSDDTSCGSSRTGSRGSNGGGGGSRSGQGGTNGNGNGSSSAAARRRKGALNAKERNLRRLESNERERMRMHSLNDAFQSLREVIPHVKKERRLSKIETLTLAKNYITALTDVIIVMRGEGEGGANGGQLHQQSLTDAGTVATLATMQGNCIATATTTTTTRTPAEVVVGALGHASELDPIASTLDLLTSSASAVTAAALADCAHESRAVLQQHHLPHHHQHHHHHLLPHHLQQQHQQQQDGTSNSSNSASSPSGSSISSIASSSTNGSSSGGGNSSTNSSSSGSIMDVSVGGTHSTNGQHHGSINNNHLNAHHFGNNSASSIDIENSFYEDPFQMM
ncbi:protein dimmed [Anopheles ziemanni]|uniref:protein dimmed n=1 Tax=Anopheles coustani TaxID=139045 RepID=UPI00265A7C17|nr:protein dimmed [Anopheles coustani]XP_058167238.1 protein dimmed [Anopheles ziemanni]